jgi:hypothetical protein
VTRVGRWASAPGVTSAHVRGTVAVVLLVAVMATACGESAERDFCTSYGEYVSVLAPISAADPTAATAADALEAIDTVRDAVVGLGANADARYTEPIETLEAALDDLHRTLATAPDDADYDTWAPLVSDSLDDARDAAARLDELAGPSCTPDLDD